MRIFSGILIGHTESIKILCTARAGSSDHSGRSFPLPRPRAIAIQALCMGIVLFDFLGAVMGLGEFVIMTWNHHPLLTIVGMAAALRAGSPKNN
jgi:hypothetical protein